MIGETYQNVKAALQQWAERRAMRKWDNLPDETLPALKPLLPRRRQWQAFGFAGGVFLAALTAPGISRVTRQEVSLALPFGSVQALKSFWMGLSAPVGTNPLQVSGLALHPASPTDVEVQAAKAMFAPEDAAIYPPSLSDGGGVYNSAQESALRQQSMRRSLPAIQAVMARFPASPLPYAAFLTRACNSDYVNLIRDSWREEEWVTPPASRPAVRSAAAAQNSAEVKTDRLLLKQCEQVAQEGERIEPDNAYFPVMLAHLHFAARDNQAALADIDRASRKARWEDYNSALIRGAYHLHDAQLGVSSSVLHQTTFDTAFFLYASYLHETARHLQLLACKQEHAGNIKGGIALRGRMMRIGATLRDQARGQLVSGPGENMFLFACIPPKIKKGKYEFVSVSSQHPADYLHSLRRQGYVAEANWVQSQLKYFTALNSASLYPNDTAGGNQENLPDYDPHYDLRQMLNCMTWYWVAGLCILTEITTLLLIGGFAAWRNYRGRFGLKRPRSFARPVVWGIGLALMLMTCALIVTAFGLAQGLAVAMDTLPILGLLCLTLLVMGLMRGARDTALTALLTFAIACVLIGTVFMQIGGAQLKANELQTASSLYEIIHWGNLRNMAAVALNVSLCTLSPLLLLVCWTTIRSRNRRVPVGWGVWRGLSASLLPLLSLLLIGYALVELATTRAEAQADTVLLQMLDNENQYTRDMYREARRNAQQRPSLRALRLLTGDIHAFNVAPPWSASQSSASAR